MVGVLPIPITGLHVDRLDELRRLVEPRYAGWAIVASNRERIFAVDVVHEGVDPETATWKDCNRYTGPTLHLAIGAALRAVKGARP